MCVEGGALRSSCRWARIAAAFAATCFLVMSSAASGLGPSPWMKRKGPDWSSSGLVLPLVHQVDSDPRARRRGDLAVCAVLSCSGSGHRRREGQTVVEGEQGIGQRLRGVRVPTSPSHPPLTGVVSTRTAPGLVLDRSPGIGGSDIGQSKGRPERRHRDVPAPDEDLQGSPEVHGLLTQQPRRTTRESSPLPGPELLDGRTLARRPEDRRRRQTDVGHSRNTRREHGGRPAGPPDTPLWSVAGGCGVAGTGPPCAQVVTETPGAGGAVLVGGFWAALRGRASARSAPIRRPCAGVAPSCVQGVGCGGYGCRAGRLQVRVVRPPSAGRRRRRVRAA